MSDADRTRELAERVAGVSQKLFDRLKPDDGPVVDERITRAEGLEAEAGRLRAKVFADAHLRDLERRDWPLPGDSADLLYSVAATPHEGDLLRDAAVLKLALVQATEKLLSPELQGFGIGREADEDWSSSCAELAAAAHGPFDEFVRLLRARREAK